MIELALISLRGRLARARRLQREDERGASVLEWALIAAVMVVAASIIGAVIYNIVTTKSESLDKCAKQAVSAQCSG
jgi:Flp pilus assembly pilin Flp